MVSSAQHHHHALHDSCGATTRTAAGGGDNTSITTGNGEGWVDSVVDVARRCNKMFTRTSCGNVCNIYVNKQVEFEQTMDSNPVERAWRKTGLMMDAQSLNINLYRQFLFDEESVVDSASLRSEDDCGSLMRQTKEDQSIMTQGTN